MTAQDKPRLRRRPRAEWAALVRAHRDQLRKIWDRLTWTGTVVDQYAAQARRTTRADGRALKPRTLAGYASRLRLTERYYLKVLAEFRTTAQAVPLPYREWRRQQPELPPAPRGPAASAPVARVSLRLISNASAPLRPQIPTHDLSALADQTADACRLIYGHWCDAYKLLAG